MTSPACSDSRRSSQALRRRGARGALASSALRAVAALVGVTAALAFEPFVVKDIRVEGVQRTEAGTVFSYLPVKVGDRIDDEKAVAGGQGAVRDRLLPRRAARGRRTAC